MSDLKQKHCESCEGIGEALTEKQIRNLMPQLDKQWLCDAAHQQIRREFRFDDFHETMAFVNGLAWIAHHENHHPDLEVGYNYCHVTFMTHALKGLSLNDFICAAKIDAMILG